MITDRRAAGSVPDLLRLVGRRLEDRIDFIQIREKDLPAKDLFELTSVVMRLPHIGQTKIIVNSRLDVALAASAHGVHLPAGSPVASALRAICPSGFLIGVSCHSVAEVSRAQDADYVLLAPIFKPLSKQDERPALGLGELAAAAQASKIPIMALGGITEERIESCQRAGAQGVAGISLFSN